MKKGDRVYAKKFKREGTVEMAAYGVAFIKLDGDKESRAYFLDEIEPVILSKESVSMKEPCCKSDTAEVIRCKDCEFWNTWDKQGKLCSCAHFTQDDVKAVYTKPDDFCSYAEQR